MRFKIDMFKIEILTHSNSRMFMIIVEVNQSPIKKAFGKSILLGSFFNVLPPGNQLDI